MEGKGARLPAEAGLLRRRRIDERIERGMRHVLVTVVAPPGYGKTQAVAAFARKAQKRVAWLDLVELDNETPLFWERFKASLERELPCLARQLRALPFPAPPVSFFAFLRHFAREADNGEQVLLVADNYDAIRNEEVSRFFTRLVEAEPANFTMILIGRAGAAIAPDKAKNNTGPCRITALDLKFTEEEARALFALHGAAPDGHELRRLVSSADGWPLALHLIASQSGGGESAYTSDSQTAYITELFDNGCFSGYDDAARNLLLRLALLPCFSNDILRRLAGAARLAETLQALLRNAFISYDFASGVYRLQKMYRGFLLHRRFLLDEGEIRHTFLTAGDSFREAEMYGEAVECYSRCEAHDEIAEALAEMLRKRADPALAERVWPCLERIPPEYEEGEPLVRFLKALCCLRNMEPDRAERMLSDVAAKLENRPPDSGGEELLGETCLASAVASLLQNGDRFPEDLRRASLYLPRGSRIQNPNVMFVGNNPAFFLPGSEEGQLGHILACVFEAAPYADRVMGGRGCGYEWLFAAEAAYHTYDMNGAKANCFQAIHKAGRKNQHDIICNAYFTLCKIAVFNGDYAGAVSCLSIVSEYAENRGSTELRELKDSVWGWFYLKMGDHEKAAPRIAKDDGARGVRAMLLPALWLMGRGEHHEALAVAARLGDALPRGMWSARLELHLIEAVCRLRAGEDAGAVDAFWSACEMSRRNRIVTPFAEYGNVMRTLVERARRSKKHAFDEDWLACVRRKATACAKKLAAVRSAYDRANKIKPGAGIRLSAREREVLDFLSKGLTREETAEVLDVSVSTVKKHIGGIYSKLGAVNRADAIRIATMTGMIS